MMKSVFLNVVVVARVMMMILTKEAFQKSKKERLVVMVILMIVYLLAAFVGKGDFVYLDNCMIHLQVFVINLVRNFYIVSFDVLRLNEVINMIKWVTN